MLEKQIEQALTKEVKTRGGWCIKLISPSMSGLPDRMVLMQGGKIGFVELKQKGKKPRPLQVRRIQQLQLLGFPCFVMDERKQITAVLEHIEKGGDAK